MYMCVYVLTPSLLLLLRIPQKRTETWRAIPNAFPPSNFAHYPHLWYCSTCLICLLCPLFLTYFFPFFFRVEDMYGDLYLLILVYRK